MHPIKGNITTQLRLIKTLIKIRHLNINVQLLFVYYHVLTQWRADNFTPTYTHEPTVVLITLRPLCIRHSVQMPLIKKQRIREDHLDTVNAGKAVEFHSFHSDKFHIFQ